MSYFQHLYKEFFGVSFTADIKEARIVLARQLLKETNDSVAEIAHRCGYTDPTYFMRLFKEHNKITALAYRKQMRKNSRKS